jgi:CBS domain-containing protein
MNVGSACKGNVITVREFDDLTTAAQIMRDKHIGYLVVAEPNVSDGTVRPVGVLTDRDIVVGVVARQVDPRTLRAGDVMTRQPVVVEDGDSLEAALGDMRRIGVRRLPVVSRAGQLVGILSLDDVLDVMARQMAAVAGSIDNEIQLERALRS